MQVDRSFAPGPAFSPVAAPPVQPDLVALKKFEIKLKSSCEMRSETIHLFPEFATACSNNIAIMKILLSQISNSWGQNVVLEVEARLSQGYTPTDYAIKAIEIITNGLLLNQLLAALCKYIKTLESSLRLTSTDDETMIHRILEELDRLNVENTDLKGRCETLTHENTALKERVSVLQSASSTTSNETVSSTSLPSLSAKSLACTSLPINSLLSAPGQDDPPDFVARSTQSLLSATHVTVKTSGPVSDQRAYYTDSTDLAKRVEDIRQRELVAQLQKKLEELATKNEQLETKCNHLSSLHFQPHSAYQAYPGPGAYRLPAGTAFSAISAATISSYSTPPEHSPLGWDTTDANKEIIATKISGSYSDIEGLAGSFNLLSTFQSECPRNSTTKQQARLLVNLLVTHDYTKSQIHQYLIGPHYSRLRSFFN